ncbi:MAG: ATP-binding protein [Phycisphaerae bacterium]|nr:ATP-binding protein [Phycisphaerae bacterium]
MKIAISSGKGGTGKTTVATNLALTVAKLDRSVAYLDCDVEEPNGFLFLKPDITETRPVNVSIPKVDLDRCNGCGKCGRICQYSAVVSMNRQVLLFPELCHGCGGCWLVCPTGAITESHRQTGRLDLGTSGGVQCLQGLLNIGEVMSPPVIRAVKAAAPDADVLFYDSPPGTSCPVIESVRDSDFVLLVTEPTPFGLHDLKLAVAMTRALELPFAVVINRADVGDEKTTLYCKDENIDILAEIPDDRRVAEAYSRGEPACEAIPEYRRLYEELFAALEARILTHAGE